MTTILLSAGDASGELHAAAFVKAFRERRPDARLLGLGGVAMEKAGVELVVHQRELAVGGLVEVLSSARRLVAAWRRLQSALAESRPDLVVLVDSPDFNIPFARRARRAGVPVLYYVAPQVWAWRRGRMRKIARRVDRLAVIFPFEVGFWAPSGVRVDFVGHPLIDRLAEFSAQHDRAAARAALGVGAGERAVVLLPGSRRNELRSGLHTHLEAARALHARVPDLRFLLALAPTIARSGVAERIRAAALPDSLRLDLVQDRTYEAILAADAALAKPGTVTVEVALLERPLVVAGRVNPLTASIMRRLVRLDSFAMPNLIAGAPVVPEFLQEAARPEAIATALEELLAGPARERQLAALRAVRERLGGGGAAGRAAAIAEEMVGEARRG